MSELFSFEKRWEALDSWMKKREQLLKGTLENWQMFRDEEETLIGRAGKKLEFSLNVNISITRSAEMHHVTILKPQRRTSQRTFAVFYFKKDFKKVKGQSKLNSKEQNKDLTMQKSHFIYRPF